MIIISRFIYFLFICSKDIHNKEIMTLSLPAPPLNLGTPPRLCYPLVIFLIRTDRDDDIHPDEAVRTY